MNERIRELRARIIYLRGQYGSQHQELIDFLDELVTVLEEELDS